MAATAVHVIESEKKSAVQTGRVLALDGLRAVAIVLVVIGHGSNTVAPLTATPLGKFIGEFGHLGVDVFFVLSGFLITSLLLNERARTGRISLVRFYERRLRRIFPAYWAFLAIVGILVLFGVFDVPLRALLLNVFYLSDYSFGNGAWWTGHTWSLAIEEQFYIFWPALLIMLGIAGAQRFAIACVLVVPLLRVITYFKLPAERDYITVMLHTRMDVLMIGCLLAIAVANRKLPLGWTKGASGYAAVAVSGAILIGGLVVEARAGAAYKLAVGYTLSALAVSCILVFVLARPESTLARVLSLRPVVWLGRISYSLYLWQELFLTPLNHSVLGRFPLNIVAATAVAAASYYFVELRFYRPKAVEGALLPGRPAGQRIHVAREVADPRGMHVPSA